MNIRRDIRRVINDVEFGRGNGSLIDSLRYQKEIEMFAQCDGVVDHHPARWILKFIPSLVEETSVDFLGDDHERNARIVMIQIHFLSSFSTSVLSFNFSLLFQLLKK